MAEIGGPDWFDEVALKQQYTSKLKVYHTGDDALSSAASHEIVNHTGRGILFAADLWFDENYSSASFQVDSTGVGDWLTVFKTSASSNVYLQPIALNDWLGGETSLWKAGQYDTVNNRYSIHLKREIRYYSRVRVTAIAAIGHTPAKFGLDLFMLDTE